MDDKVTGAAKITMESMLWMGPTFVIKRNAKLQLEVSTIEDISPLVCAHDPVLERPVKERFLDSQLLESPAHDHGPSWSSTCLLDPFQPPHQPFCHSQNMPSRQLPQGLCPSLSPCLNCCS